ncbi:hypothetical protein [Halomarina litorea]|uniref:hypothetical protein n=1 Tax=Halomarina litorea TaxID=2961595 RepID=UPI0020C43872|nr:hypothetical protein [Halomarina sp. BCD28]
MSGKKSNGRRNFLQQIGVTGLAATAFTVPVSAKPQSQEDLFKELEHLEKKHGAVTDQKFSGYQPPYECILTYEDGFKVVVNADVVQHNTVKIVLNNSLYQFEIPAEVTNRQNAEVRQKAEAAMTSDIESVPNKNEVQQTATIQAQSSWDEVTIGRNQENQGSTIKVENEIEQGANAGAYHYLETSNYDLGATGHAPGFVVRGGRVKLHRDFKIVDSVTGSSQASMKWKAHGYLKTRLQSGVTTGSASVIGYAILTNRTNNDEMERSIIVNESTSPPGNSMVLDQYWEDTIEETVEVGNLYRMTYDFRFVADTSVGNVAVPFDGGRIDGASTESYGPATTYDGGFTSTRYYIDWY